MAAVPPAAKERAPHGGRMRCSGSICRRLASLEAASHGIARRGAFQDRFGSLGIPWNGVRHRSISVTRSPHRRRWWLSRRGLAGARLEGGRAPFASTSLTGSSSSRTGFPMTASDSWSREARQRAAISGMRSSSAGTSIKSAAPAAERVPGWRAVHARRRDARRNAAAASLPAPGTSTLAHSWLTEIATRACRERQSHRSPNSRGSIRRRDRRQEDDRCVHP